MIKDTTSQKITIIGTGFSGLSTACYLAKEGYKVTVLEKHDRPGGRARCYEENGFVFDMGPSWYWMPDVFEKFFADFGKKVSDYYSLVRLSPSYQVFFSDEAVSIPSSMSDLEALFNRYEPNGAEKLKQFLKEASYKYDVGINELVYKPGLSLLEFANMRFLSGVFKLDVFTSIHSHIRKYFSHPKLIQLLEFPILFLGALPKNTPALYSLMNYADMALGTWYPLGGMGKIIEGMVSLAKELGVTIIYNANIDAIDIKNKLADTLYSKNSVYNNFNALVSSADYHHTDRVLLPKEYSNYNEKYWDSRKLAPSCLIYYIGINKQIDGLLHHNLFFDTDFNRHSQEIYTQPQWPSNPLFYVCVPSKTDTTVAPKGHENMFILIPVAPDLKDTAEVRDRYFTIVIDRLEKRLQTSIKEHIVYKKEYAPTNFITDYNALKGNAYGLANTLDQTAILKPKLKNKKVANLFYTGQLTVPGPGVPPSLISGKVVAQEVITYLNKTN